MTHSDDDDHEDDVAFTRIFDDGGRLILRDEEADEAGAVLIALDTASCTGSECHCHEVELLAQPLALVGGRLVESGVAPLQAVLDVESGELSVEEVPEAGSERASLLGRLRRLLQGDRLDALHERWRRARRQDDPDEWKETDWGGIDLEAMVPFFEIFPSRWDLPLDLDGRRYWVVDLWCLTPGCPCTDVALDFVAADDETAEHLFVNLETGEPDDPDAGETALRLWEALRESAGALDELGRGTKPRGKSRSSSRPTSRPRSPSSLRPAPGATTPARAAPGRSPRSAAEGEGSRGRTNRKGRARRRPERGPLQRVRRAYQWNAARTRAWRMRPSRTRAGTSASGSTSTRRSSVRRARARRPSGRRARGT